MASVLNAIAPFVVAPCDNTQAQPFGNVLFIEIPATSQVAESPPFEDDGQSWYWSAEWQAMEKEADENLKNGEYEDFDTIDDFIASL
jgi:hypothetical protein